MATQPRRMDKELNPLALVSLSFMLLGSLMTYYLVIPGQPCFSALPEEDRPELK